MQENDYNTECSNCYGTGRIGYNVSPILYFGAIRALPHFKVCSNCSGTGQVWDYEKEKRESDWREQELLQMENFKLNRRI